MQGAGSTPYSVQWIKSLALPQLRHSFLKRKKKKDYKLYNLKIKHCDLAVQKQQLSYAVGESEIGEPF